MTRWLYARRTVTGDPQRLEHVLTTSLRELLQTATGVPDTDPGGDGSFPIRLATPLAGRTLGKEVRVHPGPVVRRDAWTKLPLRWEATPGAAAFPRFDGAIELSPLDSHRVELALVGAYHPPLGPLGDLSDAMGLDRAARRTGERLLDALAAALTAAVDSREMPPPPHGQRVLVGEVMSSELLTMPEDTSLRTAALVMTHARISGAPVVDAHGDLVGVISDRDLLDKVAPAPSGLGRRVAAAVRHHDAVTVGEACTRPARTTDVDTPVRVAAREMAAAGVGRLVVLDGTEPVGIITRTDMLRVLLRSEDEISEAVAAVLDDLDEAEVEAEVQLGTVRLRGTARTRSGIGTLQTRVAAVDGVVEVVVDDLRWAVDDVMVPPLL